MASLPPPPGGPGWAPAPARGAEPSRWTARAALLVAFLACIIGVVGWFRPVSAPPRVEPAPTYTAAEVQAAKDKVCEAFELAWKAISVTSNTQSGEDVALQSADAANARLAMVGGGSYIEKSLTSEASAEIERLVHDFADSALRMSVLTLGNISTDAETYRQAKADLLAKKEGLERRCA